VLAWATDATGSLAEYFGDLAAKRRSDPHDDLFNLPGPGGEQHDTTRPSSSCSATTTLFANSRLRHSIRRVLSMSYADSQGQRVRHQGRGQAARDRVDTRRVM
jgi:hypothetical protein